MISIRWLATPAPAWPVPVRVSTRFALMPFVPRYVCAFGFVTTRFALVIPAVEMKFVAV